MTCTSAKNLAISSYRAALGKNENQNHSLNCTLTTIMVVNELLRLYLRTAFGQHLQDINHTYRS